MLNRNDLLTIIRKGFSFPMSIREFSIKEDAKVATYEYAGRNGAEHERVANYRILNMSGLFSNDSGTYTPEYYANKLRQLNNNIPGQLVHPIFGAFKCIMKSLQISEAGDDNEISGSGTIEPNYSFQIEFWETSDPAEVVVSDKLNQLFPATNIRPQSDYYGTRLKYTTVLQLYNAIVNGSITPGPDAVLNAERLLYPVAMRQEAIDKYNANPNGVQKTVISNSGQRTYTVLPGDTGLAIAKKFNIPFTSLFSKNSGRKVRGTAKSDQGLYRKNASKLYPGDLLIIDA